MSQATKNSPNIASKQKKQKKEKTKKELSEALRKNLLRRKDQNHKE